MSLRPVISLGAGAMAEVFLGLSDEGDLVAVKIAHPGTVADPAARALFVAEAAAAEAVMHPRLVRCLATTSNPLAMVLSYVDGISVAALLEGGPLPLGCALRVVCDVAEGLVGLLGHGRTHGDLCPRNVLVDRAGEARLTDFGASDAAPDDQPFLGTFGYAAPEVGRGARADARADAFSLGVLLWELTRGERLHGADTLDEAVRLVRFVETPAPPLDHARPDLTPFAGLAAGLLALDPAARRAGAPEAIAMLSRHADVATRATVAAHVRAVFGVEAQRRENALNAVAARYGDG